MRAPFSSPVWRYRPRTPPRRRAIPSRAMTSASGPIADHGKRRVWTTCDPGHDHEMCLLRLSISARIPNASPIRAFHIGRIWPASSFEISRSACRVNGGRGSPLRPATHTGNKGRWIHPILCGPQRRSYCRRTGRLSGPRKPNPCQRTLAGSGKVMLGKRSNSIGSRIAPTVRRDRCAPAQ